jgi:hypothetical protein
VVSELEPSVLLHEEIRVNRSPSSYIVQSPETTANYPVLDRVTIDMLSDDVLLEIFDFYKDDRANT